MDSRDVVIKILSLTNLQTLGKMRSVCKRFKKYIDESVKKEATFYETNWLIIDIKYDDFQLLDTTFTLARYLLKYKHLSQSTLITIVDGYAKNVNLYDWNKQCLYRFDIVNYRIYEFMYITAIVFRFKNYNTTLERGIECDLLAFLQARF